MSNKLQQLGIEHWPAADRLALLEELRDSLHADSFGGGHPTRSSDRPALRRDRSEPARPWRDAITDLGGEG